MRVLEENHMQPVSSSTNAPFDALCHAASARGANGVVYLTTTDDTPPIYAVLENPHNPSKNLMLDSRFAIGSISKMFTVAAILFLNEKGNLKLQDSVMTYLKAEVVPVSWYECLSEVTLLDLINHPGGFPVGLPPIAYHYLAGTDTDLITHYHSGAIELDVERVRTHRGEENYSNLGYNLLATVIEQITEMTYADFLHKIFFQPLNMLNTQSVTQSDTSMLAVCERTPNLVKPTWFRLDFNRSVPDTLLPNLAHDEAVLECVKDYHAGLTVGAGSILSTVVDLTYWIRALLNSDTVLTTQASKDIFIHTFGDADIVAMQGSLPGYMSTLAHNLNDNTTVVCLTNQTIDIYTYHEAVQAGGKGIEQFEARGDAKGLQTEIDAVEKTLNKLVGPRRIVVDVLKNITDIKAASEQASVSTPGEAAKQSVYTGDQRHLMFKTPLSSPTCDPVYAVNENQCIL